MKCPKCGNGRMQRPGGGTIYWCSLCATRWKIEDITDKMDHLLEG